MGSDAFGFALFRSWGISIHAPRVGSDLGLLDEIWWVNKFLSTLPAWGATITTFAIIAGRKPDFYPRSPRGERLYAAASTAAIKPFLSTLPAWGATHAVRRVHGSVENFYPRSPRGERPRSCGQAANNAVFLSTLPAWGATGEGVAVNLGTDVISIHAPRVGSDRPADESEQDALQFLSTLPAWGATHCGKLSGAQSCDFYPRSPRGERP